MCARTRSDKHQVRECMHGATNEGVVVVHDCLEESIVKGGHCACNWLRGFGPCCGKLLILVLATRQYDFVLSACWAPYRHAMHNTIVSQSVSSTNG